MKGSENGTIKVGVLTRGFNFARNEMSQGSADMKHQRGSRSNENSEGGATSWRNGAPPVYELGEKRGASRLSESL